MTQIWTTNEMKNELIIIFIIIIVTIELFDP